MVPGIVLGRVLEETLQQRLYMSRGDALVFTRPISAPRLAVLAAIVVKPAAWGAIAGRGPRAHT